MRRAIRIAVVVLLWTPIFALVGHVASGLSSVDLPGFNMGATGTAVQWTFNSPSLGIPATPTGELDIAHSEVTLKSGPAAYGLASIAWPGQVAAALPSFLQSEIETSSGNSFKFPFPVPNYPIRAETFYPQGPQAQSTQAGTIVMRSSAHADSTDANASINSFGIPGFASVGTESSAASNGFDPDGAVSMVRAAAKDISIANGAITIESVVSTATARSDGLKGSVAGTTEVLGAHVMNHAVTIDTNGVHVEGQGTGTASEQQAVNSILKQLGISVELASPIDTVTGAQASRALAGVIVRFDDALVDKIVALLPPEEQRQIHAQVSFDQAMTVAFAPAAVTASAARAIPFPSFAPIGAGVPPISSVSANDESARGSSDLGGGSSGSVSVPSSDGGGTTVIAAAPVVKNFTGIPVPIVILLVLIAFATSRPLMALADRLLFGRGAASACPEGKDA